MFVKKTIIKFIFGLIILPVSIVGVFYYLNRNGFFNIENIEVVIEESPVGQEQYLNPNVEGLKSLWCDSKVSLCGISN